MRRFYEFLVEADYCSGISLNCDFWWEEGTDVSFLTMAGKDLIIKSIAEAAKAGMMTIFDK